MKCTCVIKTAPTYDTYVQVPCGIHRAMVEAERERWMGVLGMAERAMAAHPCNNPHCSCREMREGFVNSTTEIPSKTVYEVKDNGDVTRGTISPSQKLEIKDANQNDYTDFKAGP